MNTILMYHRLGKPAPPGTPHAGLTTPPEEFRQHLACIKRMRRECVTGPRYSELLARGGGRKSVWITFDDGTPDHYEIAFPMLKEAGLTATFFLVIDEMMAGAEGGVSLRAAREMSEAGMEIGSHTLSHPKLTRIGPEQLRRELEASRKRLEDAIGAPVTTFCYPYGNWNYEVVDAVRTAGYELAVSTIRDNRNTDSDRWLLKRAMVQPRRRGWRFRYLFSPIYHFVHQRKNKRRWRPRDAHSAHQYAARVGGTIEPHSD